MMRTVVVVAIALLAFDSLLAQEVMVETPVRFPGALPSSLGNPAIAFVELAAVIAVGCLAATQPHGAVIVSVYVIAGLLGGAAHIGERTVANADVFLALATVALGLRVFRKNALRRDLVIALFAGSGLTAGYLMGAPVAAASRGAILAHFSWLVALQFAIALMVMFGVRALGGRAALQLLALRVIGAFAVGAGAAVLLQRYAGGA